MTTPSNSGSSQNLSEATSDLGPRAQTKEALGSISQTGVPHDIIVKEQGSDYRVMNGHTTVMRNDSVTFVNATNGIFKIQFSDYELFAEDDIELQPGATQVLPVQNVPIPADGKPIKYRCAVFCYGRSKFAKGNSMPIIILDKK